MLVKLLGLVRLGWVKLWVSQHWDKKISYIILFTVKILGNPLNNAQNRRPIFDLAGLARLYLKEGFRKHLGHLVKHQSKVQTSVSGLGVDFVFPCPKDNNNKNKNPHPTEKV